MKTVKTCKIDGCTLAVNPRVGAQGARGMCDKHYQNWYYHQHKATPPPTDAEIRRVLKYLLNKAA